MEIKIERSIAMISTSISTSMMSTAAVRVVCCSTVNNNVQLSTTFHSWWWFCVAFLFLTVISRSVGLTGPSRRQGAQVQPYSRGLINILVGNEMFVCMPCRFGVNLLRIYSCLVTERISGNDIISTSDSEVRISRRERVVDEFVDGDRNRQREREREKTKRK